MASSYRRQVENMTERSLVALLLLIAAIVPVSIAVDLLVWPGSDTEFGCHIDWVGVVPVGAAC